MLVTREDSVNVALRFRYPTLLRQCLALYVSSMQNKQLRAVYIDPLTNTAFVCLLARALFRSV